MQISYNFQGQTCFLCGNVIEGAGVIAAPPNDLGSCATTFHPACYEIAWINLTRVLVDRFAVTNAALGKSNHIMRQMLKYAEMGFDIRTLNVDGDE